jgi:Zn finger protein HypA/HybF involved in hydrogenase expression
MVVYMEQELIKVLDTNLECSDCRIKRDTIVMEVHSMKKAVNCPYCGNLSFRVHSIYQR